MLRPFIVCFLFLCVQCVGAENLLPSGTLPVLYINTIDETPINQRETYIQANAWLDAGMSEEYESLGSQSSLLSLGIRGRGNSSWWSFEKKPYKLKFDESIEFMGFKSNKHWALLHWLGSTTAYFREPLGYEAARRLGEVWVPSVDAIELVLNGDYRGLYFLSETVRVHKNRVNIPKQPDLADDPDLIKSGWLVEVDNYVSENQSILKEIDGREVRLTFHQPEILSADQQEYIESEFNDIISRIYNYEANDWLDVIDGESMARYYIVTEILQNKDGMNGSFYWHKSSDSKWIAGPLWDLSYSLESPAKDTYLHSLPSSSAPKFIQKMLVNPSFREIIKQVWTPFYESGIDWIDEVTDEWIDKISIASERDKERWTFGSNNIYNRGKEAASILKSNVKWFNDYLQSEDFNNWSYFDEEIVNLADIEKDYRNPVSYDLLGRKVNTPRNGVYIQRGKLVIR